ncbi:TetR/AcrR family transcriptional regulator [Ruegeria hyattellae]|uniref:TetR/AcrR family transcriptional regulator n=1 Tax=Ruegeria hyattellae TaxID=3233337 RepID=UPI00355B78B5
MIFFQYGDMKADQKPTPLPRYDRERWLETALKVLAKEGGARLRIDSLVKSLGVTKGSFYHHFKSREEFVRELIDFWSREFTQSVIAEVNEQPGTASERLLKLTRRIEADGLDQFDIAFRSWAAQDPMVAKALKVVDLQRYEFVRGVFESIGFSGDDLDMRVRLFLVFVSARRSVYIPRGACDAADEILLRHEFLTSKAS